jgi:hypothetical protein
MSISEEKMTDRYISQHSLPTDHERELLTILIEECSEVQKAATKMLRFGRDDGYPGSGHTNGYDLGHEFGELFVMMGLVIEAKLTCATAVEEGRYEKFAKLKKYMQTTR